MKTRILAVDDDSLILSMVQEIVEMQEWEFEGARCGQEGLEAAARVVPDVILLDVNLPDMRGWDLCRKLRENPALAKTPIVLISGEYKESGDVIQGLQNGADDYLLKPISPLLLVEKIKSILRVIPRGT